MRRFCQLLLLCSALAACDDSTRPDLARDRSGPGVGGGLSEGAALSLNVNADVSCERPIWRRAEVVAVTRRAVILADSANPADGFTAEEYRQIGEAFDGLAWETATRYFGPPADLDRNGRVLILFTRAVNELTPREATHVVGGFFHSRDLFPRKGTSRLSACSASNEAEMFYMLAPDPQGTINGHRRSKEYVRRQATSTLGHELAHLINASRRLYVNNARELEESWLDEGLAHVLEELSFYAASGLGARQNLDLSRLRSSPEVRTAANTYQVNNLSRFSRYLQDPAANSAFAANDSLATRGAAWAFLRYAADRRGGDEAELWRQLANSTSTGMGNLTAVLGADPMPWLRDWAVAVFADDLVAAAAVHEQPSWNFRSVLPAIGSGFQLRARALSSDRPVTVSVQAGSAAYLRFAVAAGRRAEVRTQWGAQEPGASCLATGAVRSLRVGEAYSAPSADALSLCFDGGDGGAEFAYLPFHASRSPGARASVTVTATGVEPAAASLVTGREWESRSSPVPAAEEAGDGGWELRLRERERRELGPRIRGGTSPARLSVAPAAGAELWITVLRTR